MPETGQVLREVSDSLLRDLEALSSLEEEKRQVIPGDPRLVDLATRIETIATRVLTKSARQRELTEQVQELVEEGSPVAPDQPIEDTPRAMSAILADWRDAERRVEAADPGSAEESEANRLVDLLREEYRRAHEERRRQI
jgi:hypothetical protein